MARRFEDVSRAIDKNERLWLPGAGAEKPVSSHYRVPQAPRCGSLTFKVQNWDDGIARYHRSPCSSSCCFVNFSLSNCRSRIFIREPGCPFVAGPQGQ